MKIDSISLQSFRRFREPLVLDNLMGGINLFAAPNESGKSTIAEAIRAAFLENHKTGKVQTLLPWGQEGASPSVRINFTTNSRRATLEKSFNKKKSCHLVIEGEAALQSEEAEQRLAQLLGFSVTERGINNPENHGIPGLLWVEQGASAQLADQVGYAHKSLRDALGGSLGELAASAGDRVIEQVQADLAQLKTAKTSTSTGELQKAEQRAQALAQELTRLEQDVATYNATVDKLAALRAEFERGEKDKPWVNQRDQAAGKQKSLDGLASLERDLGAARLQHEDGERQIEQLGQQLENFGRDETAVEERQAEQVKAAEADGETLKCYQAAEDALTAAKNSDAEARGRAELARRAERRRTLTSALDSALERSGIVKGVIDDVEARLVELGAAKEEEGRLAGFEGAADKLRKLEAQWHNAQAKLEAVATRLDYDIAADTAVMVAGEAVSGQGKRTIAEPVVVEIAGVGTIRVSPGAEDLAERSSSARRKQAEFETLLQQFGVDSIAAAQLKERDLHDARSDAKSVQTAIDALARDGLQPLKDEKAKLDGQVRAHQADLMTIPADEEGADVLDVAIAERQEKFCQKNLRDAQGSFDDARSEATSAKHRVRTAERELATAQAWLDSAERATRLNACTLRLTELRGQQALLKASINALDQQVRAANPDQLRQDISRITMSANALEERHQKLRDELSLLQGELQTKGALGLGEELAEKRELLHRETRSVEEKKRRAAALKLLLDMLTAKRQDLARRMRAPLQKHLNHYLGILFPGASMELDEDLKPTVVQRVIANGSLESGGFEDLSMGAREQLGIISRLAYADLLKEAGKPTLLILDDSLVNSDEGRLDKMKQVLFDAQKRHQILVFTCHPNSWQDIGVAPRPIQ